jgi:hypothetical protein
VVFKIQKLFFLLGIFISFPAIVPFLEYLPKVWYKSYLEVHLQRSKQLEEEESSV